MLEQFSHISTGRYIFINPEFLWGMLIILPLIAWYIYSQKKRSQLQVTSLQNYESLPLTFSHIVIHIPIVLRVIALCVLYIALARPVSVDSYADSTSYGVDIMLCLDISGSMLAQDLKPDRIEASKDIAARFINSRPQDRIGLVIFSGESFTQCPLTTDHATLLNLLGEVKPGMIEDGTAIGMGLSLSVQRLRESTAESKVIILLTDGVNNRGSIDPFTAAELAKKHSMRVYTIGVGSRGKAPYPVQTIFGTRIQYIDADIDEPSLIRIAQMTGGKYFRATNNEEMITIYEEIDTLEKTRIEDVTYTTKQEEYLFFALFGLALLGIEMFFRYTISNKFP